jgi:hypothetical protein
MNPAIPPKKAAPAFFLTLPQSLAAAKVSPVAVLWRLDQSPRTATKAGSKPIEPFKGQGQ